MYSGIQPQEGSVMRGGAALGEICEGAGKRLGERKASKGPGAQELRLAVTGNVFFS